jgi:hypothetical protein
MTEKQWHDARDSPEAMLNLLTDRASPRKLRLYAVGCCRRIWHLLKDERCRYAVEVAQRYADGQASDGELRAAGQVMSSVARVWGDASSPQAHASEVIGGAAWATTRVPAWHAAWDAAMDARMAARDFSPGGDYERERAWQAGLLRDLFGTPYRPVRIDPAWLAYEAGAVVKVARVIYDEGRFGDLPILADALEEAGCADADVLSHCRARGAPHYRGCWVVDAVLGLG